MSSQQKQNRSAKDNIKQKGLFSNHQRGKNKGSTSKQGVLDVTKALKEQSVKNGPKREKDQESGQKKRAQQMFGAIDKNNKNGQQGQLFNQSTKKSNSFQDSRILDPTSVLRLLHKQKQQKIQESAKLNKKGTLGDENSSVLGQSLSGDDILTHGGININDLTPDQINKASFDKDSDDDELDFHRLSKEVTGTHFGGGLIDVQQQRLARLSPDEWQALSKNERNLMLIQASKYAKAQNKGAKAQLEAEINELDMDFKSIKALLEYSRGDDSDDEIDDTALKQQQTSIGQKMSKVDQNEYLQQMLSKHGISADGDDIDDDEDDDEDNYDEDDDEDNYDDEDDEEIDIINKMTNLTSTTTTTPSTTTIPTPFQIDDDHEDQEFNKAFEAASASTKLSKIGLDGKAIGSSKTLVNGLSIGANVGKDDYTSQTLSLQFAARSAAGTKTVSDQEKASRHRQYLLFLEEKRLKRKSGELTEEQEDELEQQYEELFLGKYAKKQHDSHDDHLMVNAMLDGDDNDDDVDIDIATGLRREKNSMNDDEQDDDYDEDDYDEDDYDDEDDEIDTKTSKKTSNKGTSGDSLDYDFEVVDEDVGIDYSDYDDEEIEIMDVGGETSALVSCKKDGERRGKKLNIAHQMNKTRVERKAELGMFVNDIDNVLQHYYTSTNDITYKQFIAKIKVTIRDEIPYNYEFPNTFSEFITIIYAHLQPIIDIYRIEYKKNIKHFQSLINQTITITIEQKKLLFSTQSDTPITKDVKFALLTESKLRGHIFQLIFGRFFQLYHPRISASNEGRMEIVYRYLWRLLKVITQQQQTLQSEQTKPNQPLLSPPPNKAYIVETIQDVIAIADVITSYIFTINELMPRYTGRACIGLVELFSHSTKAPLITSHVPEQDKERQKILITKNWGSKVIVEVPQIHELLSYKLLMQLYPLSDSRHTIITPLQLLLSQTITECYITNNNDIVKIVFVLGLLLEIWRISEKYIPEVIATIQSLIAVLTNSFVPPKQTTISYEQMLRSINDNGILDITTQSTTSSTTSTTSQSTTTTKNVKGKKQQQQQKQKPLPTPTTTTYKTIPILLPSWREFNCIISPSTMNTISTIPDEFKRSEDRSTGILPLQWLTQSPLIQQQCQTEYFRYAIITTLCSFLTSINLHVKSLTSCNEILQPIISSVQGLIFNLTLYIDSISNSNDGETTTTTTTTKKGNNNNKQSLLSTTTNITKYQDVLTQLTTTLTTLQQTVSLSLINRKPLEKYAAVIIPKELEPRLDFEHTFNPTRRNQTMQDEVDERKRLKKKLANQEKSLRKNVRQNAFAAQLEKQKVMQQKDEARKQQLSRSRAIVQGDSKQDLQNRKNFKKLRK